MFKKALIWFSLLSVGLSSGCARFSYKEDLFQYQPAPVASNKRIDRVVGLNLLLDKRPEEEKMKLPPDKHIFRSIQERITSLLLEDFKKSNLFKEIHYPSQPTDDIIISGSIDRFFWQEWQKTGYGKIYDSPLGILPLFRLPSLFGVAENRESCIISITLEVKNRQEDKIITKFTETARASQGISMYSNELGQDITEAFKMIMEKLKNALSVKIK